LYCTLCILCLCTVLCIVSPFVCSCLFPIFVQVYRPLLPGGNSIAVNKYHITTTSECSRQENTLIYKVVTLDATKAYRRGRGIAPLIPNLGTSFRTRPVHPPVKNPEQASSFRRRRQTFLLTLRYNSRWADTRDVSVWRCNNNYSSVLVRMLCFLKKKKKKKKKKKLSAQVSK
jgi:hypothetical protein